MGCVKIIRLYKICYNILRAAIGGFIMIVPDHIKGFCETVSKDSIFYSVQENAIEYSTIVQAICSCGSHKFNLLKNELPTIDAICTECGQIVHIYDLDFYVSSSKPDFNSGEMLKYISEKGRDIFQLCMSYDYSDEFEVTDENFDVNDICSFALWAYCDESDEKIFVLEDETA